jgi:glycosyltransferase involved in cell wall biosynthesis
VGVDVVSYMEILMGEKSDREVNSQVNVAVIMCLYKTDCIHHFRQAVNSILNQDYKYLDFFVCQDGQVSADLSLYMIDLAKSEKNVHFIVNESNQGFAFSLNRLIDTAMALKRYDYIARMDGDDIAYPLRISRQVESMEIFSDISVCGTYAREFGSNFAIDKKILPVGHDELVRYSISRCPFIHPSVMFRASIFVSGVRYPLIHLAEDIGLWHALILAGHRFINIPEVLLDFRINEGTISRRKARGPLSDFKMRFIFLKKSGMISFTNIVLIFARLAFSLMPNGLIRFFYKYYR